MINGQVKIAGLKPSLAQVEGWIREVASAPVTPLPSREPVTPGSLDDPTK
jgi:hypothetical protein